MDGSVRSASTAAATSRTGVVLSTATTAAYRGPDVEGAVASIEANLSAAVATSWATSAATTYSNAVSARSDDLVRGLNDTTSASSASERRASSSTSYNEPVDGRRRTKQHGCRE